jgi:cullin-associated NEDD8-dissociated protein 1
VTVRACVRACVDYRYMACSDVLNELSREGFDKFPSRETETAVLDAVTRAVFDASTDVASLAIKCVSLTLRRGDGTSSERVCRELCGYVSGSGKDVERRDAAAMCLKTIVSELGGVENEAQEATLRVCVPALADMVGSSARDGASGEEMNVAAEAVDILHAMMTKVGSMADARINQDDGDKLYEVLLKHLEHGKSGTRKRAAQCMALLATSMNDASMDAHVNTVLAALQAKIASNGKSELYSFVLGATARAIGFRFDARAADVVPTLLQVCELSTEDYDEGAITNMEAALQAIENIVSSCPSSVQGGEQTSTFVSLALRYIAYDPNFDDEGIEDMDAGEEQEEEEYSDYEDYDDEDEDESWKVRRAAAKLLGSIITTVNELALLECYDDIMGKVLVRTRDREPSVQLDIFSIVETMIRTVVKLRANDVECQISLKLRTSTMDLIRVAIRETGSKSSKTQIAAYTLLDSLAKVYPDVLSGILSEEVTSSLMNIVGSCIGDQDGESSARMEALSFVSAVCKSSNLDAMETFVQALLPQIFAAMNDKYYKIVVHALDACASLVRVLRRDETSVVSPENAAHIKSLLDAVLNKLGSADEDQEVKEAAIHACAVILAQLNDHVDAQDQSRALGLLLERSRNDATRLTAVRAVTMVAGSSRALDFSAVAASMAREFTTFLRKANKSLREGALLALCALVASHESALQDQDVHPIVVESSALVCEDDLHLATLAISLLASIASAANRFSVSSKEIVNTSLALVLEVTRSPLVQRQTLKSIQALYRSLVSAGLVPFQSLLDALSDIQKLKSVDNQLIAHSLAKCVATVCVVAGNEAIKDTMNKLKTKLGGGATGIEAIHSLLCVGEIGRLHDLSQDSNVQELLFEAFENNTDDVKGAAALALGRVAVGNRDAYLPLITSRLEGETVEHQYSLLQSLREVIVVGDLDAQATEKIMDMLYKQTNSAEEGVRNVVAECLGRLAAANPAQKVQELRERFSAASSSALEKATLVSAVKFAVLSSEKGSLTKIRGELRLSDFFAAMSDANVNVRAAVVKTLNAVTHRESTLVTPLMADVLPVLLTQTAIVPELVRVMDLGAFKHTVDEGLDCRKAAFECVNTMLDLCPNLLDARALVATLPSGLGDHYDIKMIAHTLLLKLSQGAVPNSTDAVLASLDSFCEPLDKTLTARMKRDAVQQEIERNNDLLRGALRAVRSINRHGVTSGANVVDSWKKFNADAVDGNEKVAHIVAELDAEASAAPNNSGAEQK